VRIQAKNFLNHHQAAPGLAFGLGQPGANALRAVGGDTDLMAHALDSDWFKLPD
jgi:hypothetical protein